MYTFFVAIINILAVYCCYYICRGKTRLGGGSDGGGNNNNNSHRDSQSRQRRRANVQS
ncbi:hypothetical protein ACHAXS_000562, partial [Conticribra weissflogii]